MVAPRSLLTFFLTTALFFSACAVQNSLEEPPGGREEEETTTDDSFETFERQCGYKCDFEDACYEDGYCQAATTQCAFLDCLSCDEDDECPDGEACADGFCDSCREEFPEFLCAPQFVCDDQTCYFCESDPDCELGLCMTDSCAEDFYGFGDGSDG